MRTCLLCAHYYVHVGDAGYSEYTPGWDAEMGCAKAHWEYEALEDDEEKFRDKMLKAEECKDYVNYKKGKNSNVPG